MSPPPAWLALMRIGFAEYMMYLEELKHSTPIPQPEVTVEATVIQFPTEKVNEEEA